MDPLLSDEASNRTAPTRMVEKDGYRYAYRRFGQGSGPPLLLLQHFTGNLDNWDPAVTDALAIAHDVILLDNSGIGRSSGEVPRTIAAMTEHVFRFLDGLELTVCDVLGYSLGGMIAQEMALHRPAAVGRMILVGTAPRGGEDIMHLGKPSLDRYFKDATLNGYARLQKIFFTPTPASQTAGAAFIDRLTLRTADRDAPSGPAVAAAQLAAFAEWEQYEGERFAALKTIAQPTLVISGMQDEMIPAFNAVWLAENLADAVLLLYPDSGHGALFQYPGPFTRQVTAFLASDAPSAPY